MCIIFIGDPFFDPFLEKKFPGGGLLRLSTSSDTLSSQSIHKGAGECVTLQRLQLSEREQLSGREEQLRLRWDCRRSRIDRIGHADGF